MVGVSLLAARRHSWRKRATTGGAFSFLHLACQWNKDHFDHFNVFLFKEKQTKSVGHFSTTRLWRSWWESCLYWIYGRFFVRKKENKSFLKLFISMTCCKSLYLSAVVAWINTEKALMNKCSSRKVVTTNAWLGRKKHEGEFLHNSVCSKNGGKNVYALSVVNKTPVVPFWSD